MKLELHQEYPASLDRLWAVFGSPDYPPAKYKALGATSFEMKRFSATAGLIEADLVRKTPVNPEAVPEWALKFISAEQTVRHHTRWRRTSPTEVRAELHINPQGLPVNIAGTGTICEAAGHTRMDLSFDIDCKIPLLGGKIAKLFAEQIRQALVDDHAFTLRYLKQTG
ncbi:MAG: DUF2505 domain-containing protein [Stenotrophobium sp.]